ncbi:hypothetical protein K523DRAFT_400828, partial [Schizophyllum commune Tattone D]
GRNDVYCGYATTHPCIYCKYTLALPDARPPSRRFHLPRHHSNRATHGLQRCQRTAASMTAAAPNPSSPPPPLPSSLDGIWRSKSANSGDHRLTSSSGPPHLSCNCARRRHDPEGNTMSRRRGLGSGHSPAQSPQPPRPR